ncbi:MAG: cell division protein ZapA [bacterium]|nr:cell division protein ZapA [bacterium]
MKNERNQYKVDIFGEQYALISDETKEHIAESAELVDSLMQIASKSSADTKRTAILVALQIASELIHLKKSMLASQAKEASLVDRMEKVLSSI